VTVRNATCFGGPLPLLLGSSLHSLLMLTGGCALRDRESPAVVAQDQQASEQSCAEPSEKMRDLFRQLTEPNDDCGKSKGTHFFALREIKGDALLCLDHIRRFGLDRA
jgi:hypothetical protein